MGFTSRVRVGVEVGEGPRDHRVRGGVFSGTRFRGWAGIKECVSIRVSARQRQGRRQSKVEGPLPPP